MKQPKNTILTGIKALYLHGVISFNPEIFEFVFQEGASLSYYRKKFTNVIPTTQIKEFRNLFTEQIGEYRVYSKERLLVEIDTFKLDELLKKEALRNLFKLCDYSKVSKVYKTLRKKNRFSPSKSSIRFLDDYKIDFLGFSTNKTDLEQYVREYVLNKLYRHNINYIAKGGSVIESYGFFKRGTRDCDLYGVLEKNKELIKLLETKEENIWFEAKDFNHKNFLTIFKHQRARIVLTPHCSSAKLSLALKDIIITLDMDYSLSEKELNEIKNKYNIKARNLWKTKRKYVPLTREMIIGEKVLSALDSQNNSVWRAKDLMDIFMLSKQTYDLTKAKSWTIFKIKNKNLKKSDYQNLLLNLDKNKPERLKSLNKTLATYNVKDFDWQKTLKTIKEIIK